MTIELNLVGVKCNIACHYCYESEMREAGNFGPKTYQLERAQAGLAEELSRSRGTGWTLHGGEPLLAPIADLETMWRWGRERGHQLGIQTNGALLTAAHVALAKQYQVHVGISIDGPGDMNDLRWAGSLEKTRAATARSEAAIQMCCAAGVGCSVIVVLHRRNMDPSRRDDFKRWIAELDMLGVSGVRFHPMELDGKVAATDTPRVDEYLDFYRDLWAYMDRLPRLRIDVIEDIRALMRGDDRQVTCTWQACDPYTTAAVQGVDGQGGRSNCGRTNKDGVAHPKADRPGYERYVALALTPVRDGGCQGCRFVALCKGQCPGEGLDGDWRNRSMYCALYYGLFADVEREMLARGAVPFSQHPQRAQVEQAQIQAWSSGQRVGIYQLLQAPATPAGTPTTTQAHGDEHGDHTDIERPVITHGDDHSDCQGCHGDEHGDHTDVP